MVSSSTQANMLHYIALAYGTASLFYMLFFMNSNNRFLKLIFKIIPLLILGYANTQVILSVAAPFDIKGSAFLPRLSKFNWSLLFCLMGDAYLVFPSLFLYGLVSFAIGQGFLVMMFSDNLYTLSQLTTYEISSGVCVLVMSTCIYMYIYPCFERAMVLPTIIYTLLISLMLWCGIIQAQKFLSYSTGCGAVGAALFYLSDVLLSIEKWRAKVPMGQVLVMSTYYGAMLLISISVALSS